MPPTSWKKGDLVVHASKPEWGVGEVVTAASIVHEGAPCQRVSVRFTRAGLKDLSTAFATLTPAPASLVGTASRLESAPAPEAPIAGARGNGQNAPAPEPNDVFSASAADRRELDARLRALPEQATDPFTTLATRAAASLDLYRFSSEGGSLLDWAAAQTSLKDPLSVYSRHELEQHFEAFRMALESHVREVLRELRRQDPSKLAGLSAKAPARAQHLLKRLEPGR
ncbi:MAG: DUF3553 domain-containing protein [Planctomycetota bacterium]|nr:DUF3553 domain-containing protein [Planctomycetota bacterium]